MADSHLLEAAMRRFRARRMRLFARTFAVSPSTRILDVGGSPGIWEYLMVRPRVTILNLPTPDATILSERLLGLPKSLIAARM